MYFPELCSAKKFKLFYFFRLILPLTSSYLQQNYPATVIEDATLDTAQLLSKYNYPVESHYVTTADKYVLCMHRIPRPQGRPIFLMHGILDSSATWIFMGPWNGLGYYLYDNGYDVWMGNARGNRYSRNHTTFDPGFNKNFWKFSWHEIGFYDLPAMIDYVLQQTEQKNLTYIGHSQGTTSFFVMCSTHPDCSSKINSMHAIAPVAFMKHVKTPLLPLGIMGLRIFDDNIPELLPQSDLFLRTCFRSKRSASLCVDFFSQLVGRDLKQENATMWPVVFGHLPAGASVRQLKHYIQLVDSDRFCQYDHGAAENAKRYGSTDPPDYVLGNIKVPVGLYYTNNDYLTHEVDVQRLARLLPNVVENNLIPFNKWSHVTPVWGIQARKLLHRYILLVIKKFE